MEKLLRIADMRDLESQVSKEQISYSRMVEIINEKYFIELVNLRSRLQGSKAETKFLTGLLMRILKGEHEIIDNGLRRIIINKSHILEVFKELCISEEKSKF